MSCPLWGRSASEDEISLLIGPAAVAGTILAAIARGIRPEGMSIGLAGRSVAITGAALLAVMNVVAICIAVYANEACLDTIIVGRAGDSELSLLQMFWMLSPGVATAAIISGICMLAATRWSLPVWTPSSGWKIDHIPRVVRNGVVNPGDNYGAGLTPLVQFSPLWCVAYTGWFFVIAAMLYVTARADMTNGLLNLAGLIALATNTGIPVWNPSKDGSGQDSKSSNIDLIKTVETNIVGAYYETVASVTTTVLSEDASNGTPMVLGYTQNYIVANAHAMITDYRGKHMDAGYFNKSGDDPKGLGRAVIHATLETAKALSRVLSEADSGTEEMERRTLSAYMCTIAAHEAWAEDPAQRRRVLALALAVAWAMKITSSLGGNFGRREESSGIGHSVEGCSCCLHRWTVWRPVKESAAEEMQFLFGSSGNLPAVVEDEEKQELADETWEYIRANAQSLPNRGLLLYFWCMAMLDNGMLKSYGGGLDFFPQAMIEVQAFTPQDFIRGCSNANGGAATWKPSVTASALRPTPLQTCTVNHNELKAKITRGRHQMYPHPKVLDHVSRRMIFRGAIVQAVIWGLRGLQGLFSG